MFPGIKFPETALLERIKGASEADVGRALVSPQASFGDFLSLLSPAAADRIDSLRERSASLKSMHFGRTVRLYAPIYVSSHCVNDCAYCGFRSSNHMERRRLSFDEVMEEASILKSWGMDSVLLVSGEDPKSASPGFFERIVHALKGIFSYISIEVYPMREDSYRRLFEAGVHGLTLYQETYDRETYAKLHPTGPKRDYDARLAAIDAGASAGFHNIGVGALLGLYDWRSEAASIASHALWLRKRHWRSRNQFSFPRITPMEGGFEVPSPVSEAELEQMMLAFRIFFPQSDIFMSTRESHSFRMRAAQTCASHVSAGSSVVPGGYSKAKELSSLGQFTVMDEHSVSNVCQCLAKLGIEAVFKDWDGALGVSA